MPKQPNDFPSTPFVNDLQMGYREMFKIFVLSFIVVPVRLTLMTVLAGIAYVISSVTLFNQEMVIQTPFKGMRKAGKSIVRHIMIWIHLVAGFRVTVRGKRAAPWEAPILVLAPHSSFYDALPHCMIGAPSVVAKKSLFRIPFIGSLLRMTMPIIVDRECKNSRKETVEKIKERANKAMASLNTGEEWPQVAIFPEGTCTNRTQLITFKTGKIFDARFVPNFQFSQYVYAGIRKCPILYHGHMKLLDVQLFWVSLCRFRHELEIEYLPVYSPSEAEKTDPRLYAKNVRDLMARCLDLPVTDYSLDDAPYLSNYSKPKFEYFMNLCAQLPKDELSTGLKLENAWNTLKNSNYSNCSYCVKFPTFLEYSKVEFDEKYRRLFNIFDWKCTGLIDLREFVLARHCKELEPATFVQKALEIFCDGEALLRDGDETKYALCENNFIKIVRLPFSLSLHKCRKYYSKFERLPGDAPQRIIVLDEMLKLLNKLSPSRNKLPFVTRSVACGQAHDDNLPKNGYQKIQKNLESE
uniref:EF-hand domain-containing protein n=1 Tax=Romanomermis culicivorax TaxID=13658 RepID=A0A915L9V0_ROMCU